MAVAPKPNPEMVISLEELKALQTACVAKADEYDLLVETLGDDELKKFGTSFTRQFVLPYAEREIVDLYMRHMGEILLGAMAAKKQMKAVIDGEQPGSGKIGGPLVTRACWLGVGDDWDDMGDSGTFTPGAVANWIHSGTILMAGTDGNAIKIGENALHVIIAIGSLHPQPKVESAKFWIDGKPKPVLVLSFMRFPDALRIKELNSAYFFKHDTQVLAKIFATNKNGTITTVSDILYCLGASYIMEPQLRLHDPVAEALVGTVQDVVLTT